MKAYLKNGRRLKFEKQTIGGVFLIRPEPVEDERGVFRKHFLLQEFLEQGLDCRVVEGYVSESRFKHTLRGFHYQLAPHGQNKTLSCLKGRIYDIVVDLRISSPTYRKWQAFELNEDNRNSIYVPSWCANALLTLTDNCLIHYYASEAYSPSDERGIRFDDPAFNFVWPALPAIISVKDKSWPDFED